MRRNVIVGQSGGPTAAINASLAGVYRAAVDCGANKVYGMLRGIQGLLEEQYVDLSEHIRCQLDEELLKRTPASFLGSCRYKLPDFNKDHDVYDRIFAILDKLDVEAFIYIGGNDSMDTIQKLSDYAAVIGHSTRFIGCPKTIDNDLPLTDHTPGYGTAAKYIAATMKEILRDTICQAPAKGSVTVVEIMGRNAGWLTGAAALCRGEDCEGPDLIYLPESIFDIDNFKKRIEQLLTVKSTIVVAVSEGIRVADGRYVCELGSDIGYVDVFGHKMLTGTAAYLANYLTAQLGCKSRAIELNILQRASSHLASLTDIEEGFLAGSAAAKAALAGQTGQMVTFQRVCNDPYRCETALKDIHQIANGEQCVPANWIDQEKADVTSEFLAYAKPLIQGELQPIMVNGLPRHLNAPKQLLRK